MNEDIDIEANNGVEGLTTGGDSLRGSGKSNISHAKINAQKESFWHDKPHLPCNKQLNAHIAIVATKSIYFQ